jgi:hypothetical protein
MNRILRAKLTDDCRQEEELELKKTVVDILQGLLEGQGAKSVVYDRVLSVVHLDVIQAMATTFEIQESENSGECGSILVTENESVLRTECIVLLNMFCDYRPSLYDDLSISRHSDDARTASIEVLWHGVLNRRFFPIPEICADLAESTKAAFVEEVDRSTQERKLICFLDKAQDMYREVKHQQVLKSWNVNGFFSPRNKDIVTWLSFLITCIVNLLFFMYYEVDSKTMRPALSPVIDYVTNILNILQMVFACLSFLMNAVIRIPVIFQSVLSNEKDKVGRELQSFEYGNVVLAVASDAMSIYYLGYLTISILGYVIDNYFLSLLLLDIIVKNSTTRDVLKAVVKPRKQILMACILGVFVIYIFAFFTVRTFF